MNSLNYFNIYGHDVRFPDQMEQILCVNITKNMKIQRFIIRDCETENLLRLKHWATALVILPTLFVLWLVTVKIIKICSNCLGV